jgi:hypothetical protein
VPFHLQLKIFLIRVIKLVGLDVVDVAAEDVADQKRWLPGVFRSSFFRKELL